MYKRDGGGFLDPKVPSLNRRMPTGPQARELLTAVKPGMKIAGNWRADCERLNLELIKSLLVRPAASSDSNNNTEVVRRQLLTCINEQLQNVRKPVTKDSSLEVLCYAAVSLVQAYPSVIKHASVLSAVGELLRLDTSAPGISSGLSSSSSSSSVAKIKTPLQDVFIGQGIRMLCIGLEHEKDWPQDVLKMYVRDAVTDRVWVDFEPFRVFVAKIESAFKTTNVDMRMEGADISTAAAGSHNPFQLSPKPDAAAAAPLTPWSVSDTGMHEDAQVSVASSGGDDSNSAAAAAAELNTTSQPFSYLPAAEIGRLCMEWLGEFVLKKSQFAAENSHRVMIRFLTTAAGAAKLREFALPKLDGWLSNPNVMGTAKRLLAVICANINTAESESDMLRVRELCVLRMKSKLMCDFYVKCCKLCLLTTHAANNLNAMMACTVRNEIENVTGRQSALLFPVLFQFDRERCSRLLAQHLFSAAIITDSSSSSSASGGMTNAIAELKQALSPQIGDMTRRSLPTRLREILHHARGLVDVPVLVETCCTLWRARPALHAEQNETERFGITAIIDLINVALESQRNMLLRSLLPSVAATEGSNSAAESVAALKLTKFADHIKSTHETILSILFNTNANSSRNNVYPTTFRMQCLVRSLCLNLPANAEQEYLAMPNSHFADKIGINAAGSGRVLLALRMLPQVELVPRLIDLYFNYRDQYQQTFPLTLEDFIALLELFAMRCITVAINHRIHAATTTTTATVVGGLDKRMVEQLFQLCVFDVPEQVVIPKSLKSFVLYRIKLYWRLSMLMLFYACYAPQTIGKYCWRNQLSVRVLMEMAIVNQYSFPPPTMSLAAAAAAGGAEASADTKQFKIINETRQREEDSKIISDIQARIGRTRDKAGMDAAELERMPAMLMRKPADGVVREPPLSMLKSLEDFNNRLHFGRCLCQSRAPIDFLRDIIETKGTSSCLTWLLKLMEGSDATYRVMPVECICELLCHELTKPAGLSSDKDEQQSTTTAIAVPSFSVADSYFKNLDTNAKRCAQLLSRINSLLFLLKSGNGGDNENNGSGSAGGEMNENEQKILAFFGSRLNSPSYQTRQAARAALCSLYDTTLLRNTSKFVQLQTMNSSSTASFFMPCAPPNSVSRPILGGVNQQNPTMQPQPFDIKQRTDILKIMLSRCGGAAVAEMNDNANDAMASSLASILQQSVTLSTATGRHLLQSAAAADAGNHEATHSSNKIVPTTNVEDNFMMQLPNLDNNSKVAFVGFLAQALRVETEPQILLSYIEWLATPAIMTILQQQQPLLANVIACLNHLVGRRQLVCEMFLYNRQYSDRMYAGGAKLITLFADLSSKKSLQLQHSEDEPMMETDEASTAATAAVTVEENDRKLMSDAQTTLQILKKTKVY